MCRTAPGISPLGGRRTSRASQPRPGYRIPYSAQTRSETDVRRRRTKSKIAGVGAAGGFKHERGMQAQIEHVDAKGACRRRRSM